MKIIFTTFLLSMSLLLSPMGFAEEALAPEKKQEAVSDVDKFPDVKAAVNAYMSAWQARDFDTRYSLESWQGEDAPDKVRYLSMIDTEFQVFSWTITKIIPQESGKYEVLVLVTHNPPKQVAAFLKGTKEVRSTLRQSWGKDNDKFKHLFFVERQKMQQHLAPPTMPKPAEPKDVKPDTPVTKLENI